MGSEFSQREGMILDKTHKNMLYGNDGNVKWYYSCFGKQLKVSLKVQHKFIKQSSNHTPRNLPKETEIYVYEKTGKEYL